MGSLIERGGDLIGVCWDCAAVPPIAGYPSPAAREAAMMQPRPSVPSRDPPHAQHRLPFR